jgi:mono/diheme cytochrome c family protein
MTRLGTTISLLFLACTAVACRGWTSESPPVHLNPNMDTQEKGVAYRASDFFADGRVMRTPVDGTVARTISGRTPRDRDLLGTDQAFYRAVDNGAVINSPPPGLVVDEALLNRGRERYNIYCAPCHAQHGTGDGLVAARLAIKPSSFHTDRQYRRPLGHFYRVMTHGYPLPEQRTSADAPLNMPSYASQVPPTDRWAIALYLRALQRTTHPGPLPEAEIMQVGAAAPSEVPTEEAPPAEADSDPNEAAAANDEGQR